MKAGLWRAAALICIAAAIGFVIYDALLPPQPQYGLHVNVPPTAPGDVRVTAVDPHSPADRAGIRAGDLIWYGDSALERAQIMYAAPGSHVPLLVNGKRTSIDAPAQRAITLLLIPLAIRLAYLAVAALLAWRRPQDTSARALVVFLICYGLIIGLRNGVFATPLLSLIILQIGALVFLFIGTAAAAIFAATFPSNTAVPIPSALARIAQVIAVTAIAIAIPGTWFSHSAALTSLLTGIVLALFILTGLLVIATLVVAYLHGARTERQRRRWTFLLLGLGLAAAVLEIALLNTVGARKAADTASLLFTGVIPFGLAYVILRHRVIDVGFVLNRAVVYTVVSLVIVGTFMIVETLLSKYVEDRNHVTNLIVQLGVALGLGFSIRYVHARVDHVVDTVLFRERHLAEAAIRTFAQDASYISDQDVLLARTVKTVERYARARGAGIWLASDDGRYRAPANTFAIAPVVDENDPAVVSMRARRVSVHVRDCESALPGALAFPMIVRGELLGILVCGQKVDDETYDPDEQDALASLASCVGHALDGIAVRELRRRLAELTATGGGQPAL